MRFFVSSALIALLIIYYYFFVVNKLGTYVFPIDDSYIHLSMAKNFFYEGIWSPQLHYNFISCSSSPAYVVLLSGLFYFSSKSLFFPLIINVIGLLVLLYYLHNYFLNKYNIYIYTLFLFLFITLFLPQIQVLLGMEHIFHCLFILFSLKKYIDIIQQQFKMNDILYFSFFCSIAFLFRFETVFFLFAVFLSFTFYFKKYKLAFLTVFLSSIPVLFFVLISLKNGAYFLPNSLLLKSSFFSLHGNIYDKIQEVVIIFYDKVFCKEQFYLVLLFIISVGLYFFYASDLKKSLIFVSLITVLLHGLFSNFGWFYRYETYLIILFLIVITQIFNQNNLKFNTSFISLFIVVLLYFAFIRWNKSNIEIKIAAKNIYQQQVNMAKFIRTNYNNNSVIINDIGAISYYTQASYIDLFGLGSPHLLNYKYSTKDKALNNFPDYIEKEALKQDVKLVCIYEFALKKIPSSWVKVASWEIQDNVVCATGKVYFYAINESQHMKILQELIKFETKLDKDITINYY